MIILFYFRETLIMICWIVAALFLSTASSKIQHDFSDHIHPKFEKFFHHLSYHQKFSQQLKRIEDFQFNFTDLLYTNNLISSHMQLPSSNCLKTLTSLTQNNIAKCEY